MDKAQQIKWALLASLGWSTVACGGALGTLDDEGSGGSDGSGGDNDGSGGRHHASGGRSSSGGATSSSVSCTNPTPLFVGDVPTGFVNCEEGYRHRVEAVSCPNLIDKQAGPELSETTVEYACVLNSDCPGDLSYCTHGGFEYPLTTCFDGCQTDDDCAAGQICECGSPIGTCRAATCVTNDDCASGHLCATDVFPSCGSEPKLGCTTDTDECRSMADCTDSLGDSGCELTEQGRTCQGLAICGRPFLVRGQDRKASIARGTQFSTKSITVPHAELSQEQRRLVFEHYQRAALMEHASIAAFARFALQLLQLGAPSELLLATAQAQLDETRHADICFALANHYGTQPIGPGVLDLEGALESKSLEEVVALCIEEGCIGESLAALEVSEAAALTQDTQLRQLLQSIADDEQRHAALSFQFVSWALTVNPDLKVMVQRLLDAANRYDATSPLIHPLEDQAIAAHGVMSHERLNRVRALGMKEIVRPCLNALLHTKVLSPADQSCRLTSLT